jgi:TPR repeat protein
MKMFRHLAVVAVLAFGALGVSAQDYDRGVEAFKAGNFSTAFEQVIPLAEKGDSRAQHFIGVLYQLGKGVNQSDTEAIRWYRMAADQGYADAQENLGRKYEDGRGVPQDYVEAFKWYRLAATQSLASSQFLLGVMYQEGRGVLQDNLKAHMWYNIASANGFKGVSQWRDEIAKKMSNEAVEKAQAMASECMSSGYENCGW